jgi:hypothetical protein
MVDVLGTVMGHSLLYFIPPKDLLQLSQVNRGFRQLIHNEDFWQRVAQAHYHGYLWQKTPKQSWHQYIQSMVRQSGVRRAIISYHEIIKDPDYLHERVVRPQNLGVQLRKGDSVLVEDVPEEMLRDPSLGWVGWPEWSGYWDGDKVEFCGRIQPMEYSYPDYPMTHFDTAMPPSLRNYPNYFWINWPQIKDHLRLIRLIKMDDRCHCVVEDTVQGMLYHINWRRLGQRRQIEDFDQLVSETRYTIMVAKLERLICLEVESPITS